MLDNPGSDRIKGVSRLNQKDARTESGLFLLDGPQGLKELSRRPGLAHEIFLTELAAERYFDELSTLESAGVEITLVSERVMAKLSQTTTPQGVVAVVSQIDTSLSEALATSPKLVVVLDQARDPGNAGTILRAADAAGADLVIFLQDSVDPYNPKLVRSTAGSILHVPFVRDVAPGEAISALRAAGLQVYATSASGESITTLRSSLTSPTAWVFGNEAHGVSDQVQEMADRLVALPIYGQAESLNLATAASVCLYASAFEQHSQD
ncbi:RNA methyltransferase [Aquiluna sp. KACHI24]|uniref:TrmH family RNA methyltransferase n=1 Tax=Aquiluna sp. KACHI24 TaxID=2968831 RepID=UPI00220DC0A8|nr:RNA methyltransferase [Aquiluna sp. KACHI24]BDQ00130.1 RNA methyltransferase [Aquiluna sp. KACHI24]